MASGFKKCTFGHKEQALEELPQRRSRGEYARQEKCSFDVVLLQYASLVIQRESDGRRRTQVARSRVSFGERESMGKEVEKRMGGKRVSKGGERDREKRVKSLRRNHLKPSDPSVRATEWVRMMGEREEGQKRMRW